ncbi:3-phosphoinositide-dependent protein kinase 1 [Nymphon striatum]|nr:3-phosphoinositide-dependent protein kinase 1 [Nymphon striatum]
MTQLQISETGEAACSSVRTQINSPPNVRPTLSNPMSVNFPKSSSSHSPTLNSSVPIEPKKTPKDFIFGKVIGEGSFSSVYLAKDINSEKEFAIKVCQKRHILKEKKQASVMRERKVLFILNSNPSPYFVKLFYTFQDLERLYFVLTYAKCGEMLPYMKKGRPLNEPCAQFYAAEILCALEHLHKLGIIHRDLKPENILLNEDMHILVTDFGSAKLVNQEERS